MNRIRKKIIKRLAAITLIEVLVSIGVIGMTLTMVAGFIKYQQPAMELSGSSNELRSALNEARGLTLTTQSVHGVHFIMEANQYEIIEQGSGAPTVLKTVMLPGAISYATVGPFTNDTILFNTAGAATESGAISIENTYGNSASVIVNPSGFISIQ